MNKVIGTSTFNNYSANRNILDLKFKKHTFLKVFNWYKIPAYISFKFFKNSIAKYEFKFNDIGLNKKIDFYHFFNSVSSAKKPWIVSFESYVPYWDFEKNYYKELALLNSDWCKKIIPISHYAKNILIANILKFNPSILNSIEHKIEVIHPSQKKILNSINEKKYNEGFLSFAIVGSFFFNKGGKAIVKVFKRLITEGHPVKLLVVSSLTFNVWNVTHATEDDLQETLQFFEANKEAVTFYKSLPNDEVLRLLETVDVGLLPSLGDTYGYSTLEFMSAGCPVITTDLFVFPEINNDERGWLIEAPKDELNNPILNSDDQINDALLMLEDSLYNIILSILGDKESIQQKGANALAYVQKFHSQQHCTEKIEKIYDEL